MNRKIEMWFVLFLSLIMASCTADEGEYGTENEKQVITIRLAGSSTDTSGRAVGDAVTGKAEFKSGYLFFVTKKGSVGKGEALKQCYRIAPTGGTETDLKNFVINIDDFWGEATGSGYSFENVPGDVASIYMLGNVPDEGATAEAAIRAITTLDDLKKVAIPVTKQADAKAVTMDGQGQVTDGGKANQEKVANVQLVPFSSRVEIASITGKGDITSFKIGGIYISHFYKNVPLNETVSSSELFKYTTATEKDYGTTYSMMADIDSGSDGLGGSTLTKTPGKDKVWGYQFIPGKSGESIRIVIKLTDVKGQKQYDVPQYLNIRGFYNGSDPTKPMTLQRGKVYKLNGDITFDEGDITPIPNPDDINLTINVSVKDWEVVNVKPII